MKEFIRILILAVVIASCGNATQNTTSKRSSNKDTIETINNVAINKSSDKLVAKDTTESWFPEGMERSVFDTIFQQDNKEFNIKIEYYTLKDSEVKFEYSNESYDIYHFRDYAADVSIKVNDSLQIVKTIRKKDFTNYLGDHLPTVGIMSRIEFNKVIQNEILFDIYVCKPETDYLVATKCFVNINGNVRFEEFPDEFYDEM